MKRILLYLLLILFISINFNQLCAAPNRTKDNRTIILICIESPTLLCPLCLNQLLDICNKLEKFKSKLEIRGIYLTDNNKRRNSSRDIKIVRLKLKGFVRANHLSFSFYPDKNQVFGEDGCIIIINEKHLRKWMLPLKKQEINELDIILKSLQSEIQEEEL